MELDLERVLEKEIAARFLQAIPQEQRDAIIVRAVEDVLDRLELRYEIGQLLEAEGMKAAKEYMARPDVQERVRAKAQAAVEAVMDGLIAAMGRKLEDFIKSRYERVMSEARTTDVGASLGKTVQSDDPVVDVVQHS